MSISVPEEHLPCIISFFDVFKGFSFQYDEFGYSSFLYLAKTFKLDYFNDFIFDQIPKTVPEAIKFLSRFRTNDLQFEKYFQSSLLILAQHFETISIDDLETISNDHLLLLFSSEHFQIENEDYLFELILKLIQKDFSRIILIKSVYLAFVSYSLLKEFFNEFSFDNSDIKLFETLHERFHSECPKNYLLRLKAQKSILSNEEFSEIYNILNVKKKNHLMNIVRNMIPVCPSINEKTIRQNQVLQSIVDIYDSLLEDSQSISEHITLIKKVIVTNQPNLLSTNPLSYKNFIKHNPFYQDNLIQKLREKNTNEFSLISKSNCGNINNLFDQTTSYWSVTTRRKRYFIVHFKTKKISISSYTLGSYTCSFPKGWKVEGSNDNIQWTMIDQRSNQRCFTASNTNQKFDCKKSSDFFCYIKITATQRSYDQNNNVFTVSFIEFSGQIQSQ
jgi:hypothetical protein